MVDEIIKELWRTKDGIAKEFHYDVKALVAHLRTKQHEGDQEVVDLRSKMQRAQREAKPGTQELSFDP